MHPNKPIKRLFQQDQVWKLFVQQDPEAIRPAVLENIARMLACATSVMGTKKYQCPSCPHSKYLFQSCGSRACSTCGVKATEQWIQTQQHILPDCEWQHITFTMPDKLWEVFRVNRWLMGALFSCAAQTLQSLAKDKDIDIGLFCALHTYGRKLNWNTHIHLSVTRGGLCLKTGRWKPIFFKSVIVEKVWRIAVLRTLRQHYRQLDLCSEPYRLIRDEQEWSLFLSTQYRRYWKVHFAKKTKNLHRTVNYLGRYLKKLPISASRLRHYGTQGTCVSLDYLNHRSGEHETLILPPIELIKRLIEHIPDKHFRMIRYYGFLSNRRRGKQLPEVYEALKMPEREKPKSPGYAAMLKQYCNVDPYECILCKDTLVFKGYQAAQPLSSLLKPYLQSGLTVRPLN